MQVALRVLITSCGRRVQLLRSFTSAFEVLDVAGQVVTVDAGTSAPASFLSEEHYRLPSISQPGYIDALLALCVDRGIDIVVPTIDTELEALSAHRNQFLEAGIHVIVSDSETVAIASDKRATNAWLGSQNIPRPRQWDLGKEQPNVDDYPVVLKPRAGSMSVGVVVSPTKEHADSVLASSSIDLVAESIAPGREYTVSAYVDARGHCLAAVPRRRLEVRGGEVSKGVTTGLPEVERLVMRIVEALPGARGPMNVQVFHDESSGKTEVIEINARFGGGDPLAWRAGADAPRWILEEHLGLVPTVPDRWEEGLVMLRFDDAVYVAHRDIE